MQHLPVERVVVQLQPQTLNPEPHSITSGLHGAGSILPHAELRRKKRTMSFIRLCVFRVEGLGLFLRDAMGNRRSEGLGISKPRYIIRKLCPDQARDDAPKP